PKEWGVHHRAVILEPDEVAGQVLAAGSDVAYAEAHGEEEGDADQQDDIEGRREDQQVSEHRLPLEDGEPAPTSSERNRLELADGPRHTPSARPRLRTAPRAAVRPHTSQAVRWQRRWLRILANTPC